MNQTKKGVPVVIGALSVTFTNEELKEFRAALKAIPTVVDFLDKIGYDAVDMGPLAESWRSEPTMPIYVNPYWGLDDAMVAESFMDAPGRVVTREAAAALLAQAVRHDKMFGSLGAFDVRSKRL